MKRCGWVKKQDDLDRMYHDTEWGRPLHDEQALFELFCLESYQSGVSWLTVLHKRQAFNHVFKQYDIAKVAAMTDKELEVLLSDETIIRHRGKLFATRNNAQQFLQIQKEFGSFDNYIWSFVNHHPINNKINHYKDAPSQTVLSEQIAKELKKRGFKYIGPTMIYSFMQAAGLVNDHEVECSFNPNHTL
ncbi:DNA-3-methyladenine glycosylase I [Streptococcus sp. CSL10205-OR2]|uniref:DNA-3-methyladenine glycosylase I n=1 Tax=Streptococcus sp. CSL10205-OR2 TaxID=2980558 RepID=UPI0021DA4868|nr:DNA-3-methyladenine glycosylase I [Streptococcus sp. CSL10205-OR2]MCU9533806.1 DNA-3-methyladenine glycosylase I [Streptococcus sp. CSL10205-OR2]